MDRVDAHNLMLFFNRIGEGMGEQIDRLPVDEMDPAALALRDYFSQMMTMGDALGRIAKSGGGNIPWEAIDDHIGVDVFIPGSQN